MQWVHISLGQTPIASKCIADGFMGAIENCQFSQLFENQKLYARDSHTLWDLLVMLGK